MKKYLVVFLSLIVAINVARAEADPGQLYADAFILLQDGQIAEQKSDWSTAFQKYNAASEILTGLRKSTPDWNPHVVEYRLKDTTGKLDAVRSKVPASLPVVAPAPVVPVTPVPLIVAPVVSNPEIEKLKSEIKRLTGELEAAKKSAAITPRAEKQIDALKLDKKKLADQLETSDRELAGLKEKLSAKPVESPELKKLRSDLIDAKAEAEKVRGAQAKLQQDNKDLASQLDVAKKAVAAKPVESPELKKLRTELADAKADSEKARTASQTEATKLQGQINDLTSQLAAAKKTAAVESPELKKLRSDLADSKSEIEKVRTVQQAEIAKLQEQTKNLTGQLETARKQTAAVAQTEKQIGILKQESKQLSEQLYTRDRDIADLKQKLAAKPVESPELKKLRTELTDVKADSEKARTASQTEATKLQGQINDLTGQLAAVKKAAAVESPELKKLRGELGETKAGLEKANAATGKLQDENKALTGQLDAAKKVATKPVESPELKKLRSDLADAKAEAEKARGAQTKLQQDNKTLGEQLDAAKKAAAVKPVESPEVKKLRGELADAKADAEKANAAKAKLQQENQDLTVQVANAKKVTVKPVTVAVTAGDSEEVKNLRDELARVKAANKATPNVNEELYQLRPAYARAKSENEELKRAVARAEVDRAERIAMGRHVADLEKANADFRDQLAALKKQPAKPVAPVVSEKTADLEKQIANLQKQNADLKIQLNKLQPAN